MVFQGFDSREGEFCFMYSVENPAFRKRLSPLDVALYGPRFTGVGAQILALMTNTYANTHKNLTTSGEIDMSLFWVVLSMLCQAQGLQSSRFHQRNSTEECHKGSKLPRVGIKVTLSMMAELTTRKL